MLDAEVRIGELMAKVPKATNQYKSDTDSGVASTKREVIESTGFTPKQVERFQQLAAHPEMVEVAGISPCVNVRGLPCG